jgi:hypothetical protein
LRTGPEAQLNVACSLRSSARQETSPLSRRVLQRASCCPNSPKP